MLFFKGLFGYVYVGLFYQHQQQVAAAVERAKQVTMQELNAIIGVSFTLVDNIFVQIDTV
jgi:Groucho/TLE N-terminal Q-rich domain